VPDGQGEYDNAMTTRGLMLRIEDFHGDCRYPRYAGWIDLLWFSFGGSGEFGQNRPVHSAAMKLFVGRISTDLQLAYLRGDRFRSASLVALNHNHTAERFHAAMDQVRITGFQFEGTSLDRAVHSLELTFFAMTPRETPDVPAALPFVTDQASPCLADPLHKRHVGLPQKELAGPAGRAMKPGKRGSRKNRSR